MPRYIRMKKQFLQGLLWLYLTGFGFMALSLEPGFLDFDNLPDTNFSCVGKVIGGYYADLETNCQMFHVCTIGQLDEPMDIRFLCLNGTVFDQETRVCERIDEVDCSKSEQFYSLNLELYGNTQPAILDDSVDNTDPPIIIKSTTPTTTTTTKSTTTTTTKRPKPRPSTSSPPRQYPSDIRYNPEEINVSLNPSGHPPNIRAKSTFKPFQDNNNANTNNNNKKILINLERPNVQITTEKPKSIVSYELQHNPNQRHPATPSDINYSFTYGPTEEPQQQQQHHLPAHNYHYHSNVANFRPSYKNPSTTTSKTVFVHTFKPSPYNYHHQHHTEKPQRVQLPLPTLPPITFSSPAPFTLQRHIETKRYTKEQHHHHQQPPRIIISASASVSDDSGRRLNYSLGTAQVYDNVDEDEEVNLEQFYHDVPKIPQQHRQQKTTRNKRSVDQPPQNIIRNEQEAVEVLKILVDWYKNNQQSTSTITVPLPKSVITEINDELSGNQTKFQPYDYVDDNYEAVTQRPESFHTTGPRTTLLDEEITKEASTSPTMTTRKKRRRDRTRLLQILDEIDKKLDVENTDTALIDTTVTSPTVYQSNEDYLITPLTTTESYSDNILPQSSDFVTDVNNELEKNENLTDYNNISDYINNIDDLNLNSTNDNDTEIVYYYYYDYLDDIYSDLNDNNTINDTENRNETFYHLDETDYLIKLDNETSLNSTENYLTVPIEETTTTTPTTNYYNEFMNNTEELVTEIPTTTEEIVNNTPVVEETTTTTTATTTTTTSTTTARSRRIKNSRGRTRFVQTLNDNTYEDNTLTTRNEKKIPTTPYTDFANVDIPVTPLIISTLPLSSTASSEPEMTTIHPNIDLMLNNSTFIGNETISLLNSTEENSTEEVLTTFQPEIETTIVVTEVPSTEKYVESTTDNILQETTLKQPLEGTTILDSTTTEGSTTFEVPTTTPSTTTTTTKYWTRRTRPTRRRVQPSVRRKSTRHRFSTDIRTILTTSTPPTTTATTETRKIPTSLETLRRYYRFNCFGKKLDKFYPDPRDCRLFHYCTQGYNNNQLLDMKFVCDLGTYFDDKRLICTKNIPDRCLYI